MRLSKSFRGNGGKGRASGEQQEGARGRGEDGEKREEEYVCVTVVVKEGDGLREGCGVCTCAEKGIEWLLPCVVGVCSRGVGERGVAEAVANEKKKCVARRERRVIWCSVNVCETSREDGKWAAAAGVRWKLVYVYRMGTAACLGVDGGEGGG